MHGTLILSCCRYLDQEANGSIKGCIPLQNCTLEQQQGKISEWGSYTFVIRSELHRNFYLSAFDKDDLIQWIRALTYSCQLEIDQSCEANVEAMKYLVSSRPELVDELYQYAHPELIDPEHTGWLVKRGSGFPYRWQRRFFVLQAGELWYFKDQGQSKGQGKVSLDGAKLKVEKTSRSHQLEFELALASGRSLMLRCEDQTDWDMWMEMLVDVYGLAEC